jgi:hypothetical protein
VLSTVQADAQLAAGDDRGPVPRIVDGVACRNSNVGTHPLRALLRSAQVQHPQRSGGHLMDGLMALQVCREHLKRTHRRRGDRVAGIEDGEKIVGLFEAQRVQDTQGEHGVTCPAVAVAEADAFGGVLAGLLSHE